MEQFSCVTCGIRFEVKEGDNGDSYNLAKNEHKEHFKSDWHRYNLKRKVLELPAVTLTAFNEKVLQQRAQKTEAVAFSQYCNFCNKSFSSKNALENHIKSNKHKELEKKKNTVEPNKLDEKKNTSESTDEQKMDVDTNETVHEKSEQDDEEISGSEEEWDGEALGLEECLFCSKISKTMEKNIEHMTVTHGFFIPDLDYVCDLEGLMTYLGQLVGELHICLWCKAQRFHDTLSIQQHMIDKGHCKMLHEGESIVEYADYYDYRKSYPDFAGVDSTKEEGEEGEEVQPTVLEESGYQLVLPSGSTVGHRALMRYFRQKLRPERQLTLHRDSSAISKVVAHYKALGWTGTTGVAAEKKAKDIAFVNRIKARQYMKLGVKANSLQKHFRDQVFGF